jgi:hypothetical protein
LPSRLLTPPAEGVCHHIRSSAYRFQPPAALARRMSPRPVIRAGGPACYQSTSRQPCALITHSRSPIRADIISPVSRNQSARPGGQSDECSERDDCRMESGDRSQGGTGRTRSPVAQPPRWLRSESPSVAPVVSLPSPVSLGDRQRNDRDEVGRRGTASPPHR